MKIGVPKEIKPQENRIGLTPESVKTLVGEGHEVLVENNGGFEAGFDNDQYTKAGAKITKTAGDIFNDADIIVKVKEPQKIEVDMLRENQILYTYLHLAAAKELAPYFQEGLFSLQDIDVVDNIRGYGMMGGIDIKTDGRPGKAGLATFKHCYDAGVNFKATGDCLIIAPMFICEKKHIDEIIEKLRTGITNYSKSKKN